MADHSNAGASENVQTRKIRPWIAGLLTFFGWGVGLYYARRTKAAIFMDHVFDLASLVDHLGATRFRLVGHSLGGNIALRYAGLFPDRLEKLVAIEGLGPSPKLLAERNAMKLRVTRTGKALAVNNPIFFLAQDRQLAEEAVAGDIVGISNHESA